MKNTAARTARSRRSSRHGRHAGEHVVAAARATTRLHRDRHEHRTPQRPTTIQRNNPTPTTNRLPRLPRPTRDPPTQVLASRQQQLTPTQTRSPTESS
jgi:hypothetical protein